MEDGPGLAGVYITGSGEIPGLERMLTLQEPNLWKAAWPLFLKADQIY